MQATLPAERQPTRGLDERGAGNQPPDPVSPRDRALTEDVRDLLAHDGRLSGGEFSVSVHGGVAHLSGVARSAAERDLMRRVVGRVRGVWDVLCLPGQGLPRVLDIGCGRTKQQPFAVGVDCHSFEGVDVVTDLENAGLPSRDREIDQVYAVHFLEHVRNLLGLMNEIHRVLRPDGVLHVMVPNASFVNALADPTHVRFFHLQTFKFFCRPYPGLRPFRPLAAAAVDNLLADLQPVQPGEPLPTEEELARFFD